VSVDQYREDPLYPRIVRAVEPLLARGKVVAPVDVLVGMGLLDPAKLEEAYSRHFVWPGKGPFHPPGSKEESPSSAAPDLDSCGQTSSEY
jgi:hypothetical protein